MPAVAVSVVLFPEQIVNTPLMAAAGADCVTITGVETAEQLPNWVTVTVYVPAAETTIESEVAPLLHK